MRQSEANDYPGTPESKAVELTEAERAYHDETGVWPRCLAENCSAHEAT